MYDTDTNNELSTFETLHYMKLQMRRGHTLEGITIIDAYNVAQAQISKIIIALAHH